ncbi:cellulose synthase operon protein YhjQ [Acidovorax sp. 69]|uniref:cellulose biosynthesis protein BcsQ n=1 Tax=Acidovorax sp. 69 TaxID=2035202 RepID=UPI000C24AAFF|nr:cellulose biosynthesis protein BcsQ [Acidovorax sp. 69]PJI96696.1 cellulose synthase operon protein YhjQ [Acidovorax sp. 69]
MRVIAVVSPLGGSGRTTLTAHLATLLARQGQPCLAVELCAQNLLSRHLGMQEPSALGWAALAANGQWWADGGFDNSDGVAILPFGKAGLDTLETLHRQLQAQPRWLLDQMELLDVPANCTVLLDTPAWPSPLAQAALRCADAVLVTLEASTRACANPLGVQAMLQEAAAAPADQGVLVTRFDPRRISHREALQTLRGQWGERLIPYTLHEDENIPRALARSMCVGSFAPQAQSAHDLQGVCNWLSGQRAAPLSMLSAGAARP